METNGFRFGGIPRAIPVPVLPSVTLAHLRDLIVPAFTIALLAAIESLLCAVVADKMTHDKHDANEELVAQGLANFASACSAEFRPPARLRGPPRTSGQGRRARSRGYSTR